MWWIRLYSSVIHLISYYLRMRLLQWSDSAETTNGCGCTRLWRLLGHAFSQAKGNGPRWAVFLSKSCEFTPFCNNLFFAIAYDIVSLKEKEIIHVFNGAGYGYPQPCVPVVPVAAGYGGGCCGGGFGGCCCAFILILFILIIICGCGCCGGSFGGCCGGFGGCCGGY